MLFRGVARGGSCAPSSGGTAKLAAKWAIKYYRSMVPKVCSTDPSDQLPGDPWAYRIIHKSLRDFRALRYSSQDGHAEGELVNRGRDTPSFCPTLQVLDMSSLGDAADVNPVIKFLPHTLLIKSLSHT